MSDAIDYWNLPSAFTGAASANEEETESEEEQMDETPQEEAAESEVADDDWMEADVQHRYDDEEDEPTNPYVAQLFARSAPTKPGRGLSPQEAYSYYIQHHNLAPHVAAGIVGNLQQESGLSPHAVGDGGTSFGMAQWHNDRWSALQSAARKQGRDAHDPYFQLDYVVSEPGESGRMLHKVNQTRTPEEAATVMGRTYERYNPAYGNERGRQANARQVMNYQMGGNLANAAGSAIGTVIGGPFGGMIGSVAGGFINNVLDNVFNPGAKDAQGAQNGLDYLQQKQLQQNNQLDAYRKAQQQPMYQAGGSTFASLRATKPFMNLGVRAATDYKQDQFNQMGMPGVEQSTAQTMAMEHFGKQEGNNPMNRTYTPQSATTTSSGATALQVPGDWMDNLFGGNLGLGVQAAASLFSQQDQAKVRQAQWDQLADQPYQKIRTNRGLQGPGLPAYGQQGGPIFGTRPKFILPSHPNGTVKDAVPAANWTMDWFNNPATQNRLRQYHFSDEPVSDMIKFNDKYIKSSQEDYLQSHDKRDKVFVDEFTKDNTDLINEQRTRLDNFRKGIAATSFSQLPLNDPRLGVNNTRNHRIRLSPKDLNPQLTLVHELAHTDVDEYKSLMLQLNEQALDVVNKREPKIVNTLHPQVSNYLLKEPELYPRIQELRFEGGLKPGEKVTPDQLNRIKKNLETKQYYKEDDFHLLKHFKPDTILEMLNTLAHTSDQNQAAPYGQYGFNTADYGF